MSKKIDPRSPRPLLPDPSRLNCTYNAPGHNVHWIQALHSANKKAVSAQSWPGKVAGLDGEVLTVRKPDDSLARFRIHDPARLVVILQDVGVDVTVNDQYAILPAGITAAGSFFFSVQADRGEPLRPCPTDELPPKVTGEQLVARIRTHGGFSAPAGRLTLSAGRPQAAPRRSPRVSRRTDG
jgi:hypothetical protein